MTRPRHNAHGWLKGDVIRRSPSLKVELLDDGRYESGDNWGLWSFRARVLGTDNVIRVVPMTTDENLTVLTMDKK